MRAIAPRTGAPEQTFAEDQLEYQPITVAIYADERGNRTLLTRWQPSVEERAAIASGEDIYIAQWVFRNPMTPMNVTIGPGDWTVKEGT